MKRKTMKLALVIAFATAGVFTSNVLRAQVTIGGDVAPKLGAILDLNSDTKGGLLFPNIEITDVEKIPGGNVLSGISEEADANDELKGTVIYKPTDANSISAGLYVWNGEKWLKLIDAVALAQLKAVIDEHIGELGDLDTYEQGSVVGSINELNDIVIHLTQSTEVAGSPYPNYTAFLADILENTTPSTYAYVTFPDKDNVPTDGRWESIELNQTWRLDRSTTQWSPTSNMTAAVNATLVERDSTLVLKGIETTGVPVSIWLQSFRDNLKALVSKFDLASGTLKLAAGGTGVDGSNVAANKVLASPGSGGAGGVTYRPLVAADIPSLDAGKITTGALPIDNGGTGATTTAAARNALGLGNTAGALPLANGGTGSSLAYGTAGQMLTSNGSGGAAWSSSLPTVALNPMVPNSAPTYYAINGNCDATIYFLRSSGARYAATVNVVGNMLSNNTDAPHTAYAYEKFNDDPGCISFSIVREGGTSGQLYLKVINTRTVDLQATAIVMSGGIGQGVSSIASETKLTNAVVRLWNLTTY